MGDGDRRRAATGVRAAVKLLLDDRYAPITSTVGNLLDALGKTRGGHWVLSAVQQTQA